MPKGRVQQGIKIASVVDISPSQNEKNIQRCVEKMQGQLESFMNVLDPNYKKTAKKSVAFQENDESNYQTACIRKSEKIESLVDNLLNLYKDYHSKCESIDGEIS